MVVLWTPTARTASSTATLGQHCVRTRGPTVWHAPLAASALRTSARFGIFRSDARGSFCYCTSAIPACRLLVLPHITKAFPVSLFFPSWLGKAAPINDAINSCLHDNSDIFCCGLSVTKGIVTKLVFMSAFERCLNTGEALIGTVRKAKHLLTSLLSACVVSTRVPLLDISTLTPSLAAILPEWCNLTRACCFDGNWLGCEAVSDPCCTVLHGVQMQALFVWLAVRFWGACLRALH
jgi:hypothetical protein